MQLKLSSPRIWLANQAVDFRKSINGLSEVVSAQFDGDLREDVFIFYNRRHDKLKLLAWHGNGFILLYKRLEKGYFTITESNEGQMILDEKQLSWLLAGLNWDQLSHWKTLEFDDFF